MEECGGCSDTGRIEPHRIVYDSDLPEYMQRFLESSNNPAKTRRVWVPFRRAGKSEYQRIILELLQRAELSNDNHDNKGESHG